MTRWPARWSGSRSSSASDAQSRAPVRRLRAQASPGLFGEYPETNGVSDHVTGAWYRDDPTDQVAGPHGPAPRCCERCPTRHNQSDARVHDIARNERPDSAPDATLRGYTMPLERRPDSAPARRPGRPSKRPPDSGAISIPDGPNPRRRKGPTRRRRPTCGAVAERPQKPTSRLVHAEGHNRP